MQGIPRLTADQVDDHMFGADVQILRRGFLGFVVEGFLGRDRQQDLRLFRFLQVDGGFDLLDSQQILQRRDLAQILQDVVQRVAVGRRDGLFVLQQQLMRVDDFLRRDEDGRFRQQTGRRRGSDSC